MKILTDTKKIRALLWISGAATLIICAVMNLWLIPAIESGTEGIRCFDMQSLGYSADTANRFLSLLGEKGRNIYLHAQLPLDFFYPIAYGTFFSLLMRVLKKNKPFLVAFPALLMLFDYAENVCSIIMLREMSASKVLAGFAAAMTVVKSLLLSLVAIICIVLVGLYLMERIRGRRTKEANER